MTSEQATWLADEIETIVADPQGFLQSVDMYDVTQQTEFLVEFAKQERDAQLTAEIERYNEWAKGNDFESESSAAVFLYHNIMPALKELANAVGELEARLATKDKELETLDLRISTMLLRFGNGKQDIVDLRNTTPV